MEMPNKSNALKLLVKSTAKLGFQSFKLYVLTFLAFGLLNAICFVFGMRRFVLAEKGVYNTLFLGASIILGLMVLILAILFTYRYILKHVFRTIYNLLTPFFEKLAIKISENIKNGKINLDNPHTVKILDLSKIVLLEVYGRSVPRIVRRVINFVIRRIPFTDIILNIKTEIAQRDNAEASHIIYNEVDNYLVNNLLKADGMPWVYLLAIDTICQTVLILLIK